MAFPAHISWWTDVKNGYFGRTNEQLQNQLLAYSFNLPLYPSFGLSMGIDQSWRVWHEQHTESSSELTVLSQIGLIVPHSKKGSPPPGFRGRV
jgi:hypothetical protein